MPTLLPMILTPVFQPVLKEMILIPMYYMGIPTDRESLSDNFLSILDTDGLFFNCILYLITFFMMSTIVKIILGSSDNSSEKQKSNVIKSIEQKENIKVKELNENISYKVSLTKK